MYYVYLLEEVSNKGWYIGYTSDLRKRLTQHNSGNGGRTTKNRLWKLFYAKNSSKVAREENT
ncbi:MAG: GIY-YIG nuclease family protein [Patescibacteria group bacterium]